jgi:hypothetical protein
MIPFYMGQQSSCSGHSVDPTYQKKQAIQWAMKVIKIISLANLISTFRVSDATFSSNFMNILYSLRTLNNLNILMNLIIFKSLRS